MELGYVKHDINTMNDIKIRRLVQAEGAQGYALFWHLVECIYQNDGSFARNDVDLVGWDLGVSQEDSQRIIGRMLKLGLLYEQEGGVLRSKRVDKDMREISEKCESYRNMASKRWKKPAENPSENTPDEKPRQCHSNATAMPQQCHSNAKAMQGSVLGSVLGSGSVRERDCSDSLHSSSLPSDDEKSPAGPIPEAKSPETPPLGFDEPLKPDEPVFLEFPRIGKTEPYGVTESDVAKWEGLFPAIDVRQVLRNALAWLNANPRNGKTNIPRFLTSWLTREQDKAGPQRPGAQPYRRVASDRTPGYDLGRTHVFDNTRPGGEVRT